MLPRSVWGLCQGSDARPYQTCVDLTEPAYLCSCPSRKFPCKHTLAILLRWASGTVPEAPAPGWVREWQASRADRVSRAADRAEAARHGGTGTGRAAGEKATLRRAARVAAGLDELDRWLADQVRGGLAGAAKLGYAHWDAMAARLIDAQAPGAARLVRNLADYAGDPERLLTELGLLRLLAAGFARLDSLPPELAATVRLRVGLPVAAEEVLDPERLLTELGLLRLLAAGFARLDSLPPELAATVRLRVGLPVAAEEVLAGAPVRDRWQVLGVRDEPENDLMVCRVWLRGAQTGRAALVLSF